MILSFTLTARVCNSEIMPADAQQPDHPTVVSLAQHPRYQHVEWSVTERLVRRQEQVLRHRRSADRVVKRLARKAGIEWTISCHSEENVTVVAFE